MKSRNGKGNDTLHAVLLSDPEQNRQERSFAVVAGHRSALTTEGFNLLLAIKKELLLGVFFFSSRQLQKVSVKNKTPFFIENRQKLTWPIFESASVGHF